MLIPRRPVCVLLSGLLLSVPGLRAAELNGTPAERLTNDIKYLSSDDLEGRGVGTEGLNKAAEFIKKSFAESGLKVDAVGGDAFQKFTMVTGAKLNDPNSLALTGPEGKQVSFEIGKDATVCSFGGAGKFSGELVFAGYGINAQEANYNDFDGVDVKGKIVIVMRKNPQQDNPKNPFGGGRGVSRHADINAKVAACKAAGAAAVLFVNDPQSLADDAEKQFSGAQGEVVKAAKELVKLEADNEGFKAAKEKLTKALENFDKVGAKAHKGGDDALMPFGYAGNGKDDSIPALHITLAKCNEVLQATLKKSLADIQHEIDSSLKPQTKVLAGWSVAGQTSVERVRTEVKNVIGVLEGEGPHSDETIVIGAHYDHVGRGGAGSLAPGSKEVHNGADDNASGSVSLLEVARRLGTRKEKLPRRLVFIAFTAEESGLIGSAKYVEQPVIPLDKTIAMYNMDMVGRLTDNTLTIYGTGTSPTFKDDLTKLNGPREFKLTMKPEGFGPSDHSSFYSKKIPVLHFFTGTHNDYHRPSDDWDKINFEGMTRVVGLVEDMVTLTALTEKKPEYVSVPGSAQVGRSGNRPYFGTIPDFGKETKGYAISGAAPGSPAEKGGLKAGDAIIQLGTHKISDLDSFDLALRAYSAGQEIEVTVLREMKEVKLKVTLGAPR